MNLVVVLVSICILLPQDQTEQAVRPHHSAPELTLQPLFSNQRFPNVVVALDGTVVATWGQDHLRSRRSGDGGKTWEPVVDIRQGDSIHGGGCLVDERSGDLLFFAETAHPPATRLMFRSKDQGQSWTNAPLEIKPNSLGHVASLHMNESGLTLKHGPHAGRLIRASRHYAEGNDKPFWPGHYTNAIFSDDHGATWQSSEPFPAYGTGEACIVELSNGDLYYNSRRHWAPAGENPRRRYSAVSRDGGQTWTDLKQVVVLPDGPQDTNYGLMAGMVRLDIPDRDILIFSNVESESGRKQGTAWASFDGGQTWPIKRRVFDGDFAYSSLAAGRPGTLSQGWIFLLFEGGPHGDGTIGRFNLDWLLQGEPTGDGEVPSSASR
ncbi:MAG: sialidase family protein [Pirellulaceae bacterium]|nr:sialidase family protein [Pirellulaceae bacterium]